MLRREIERRCRPTSSGKALPWKGGGEGSGGVPLLLAVSFGRGLFGFATALIRRLPRSGIDLLDSFLGTFSMEPEAIAAVLHGILVGPVAPEIEERRAIAAPTLIIGHENDLIHPFSDAENLAEQIPDARLVQARSMFELRLDPERLTGEIVRFLDEVCDMQPTARQVTGDESVAR
jgi:pimeloyl-ACP methyl ester carboxylesterase